MKLDPLFFRRVFRVAFFASGSVASGFIVQLADQINSPALGVVAALVAFASVLTLVGWRYVFS